MIKWIRRGVLPAGTRLEYVGLGGIALLDLLTGAENAMIVVDAVQLGAPAGTIVTVEEIFRHVPARLKFLKTPATEAGHIADLVSAYALGYPHLRFSLINEGRLSITKEYAKTVTYHDPCYLGRHNGIYDEPREVLQKIPGLELREMADTRETSLCCGGGGGRIWMETPKEERFADLRLRQAVDVGAEVLATSCPYCITNFTDSSLDLGPGEAVEIKDIAEIVLEVI